MQVLKDWLTQLNRTKWYVMWLSGEWLFRAHVTNTQLGQEEQSGGVRLTVIGGDNDGVDVPVRIVVAPKDMQVVRGSPVTELHCIANARFVFSEEKKTYIFPIIACEVNKRTIKDAQNLEKKIMKDSLSYSQFVIEWFVGY